MAGKNGIHGCTERVRVVYSEPNEFFKNCYVVVKTYPLTKTDDVHNWLQKGECVKHEYVSFSKYLAKFGMLQEFNNHLRSKKSRPSE
jgi:hypothetical protein